MGASSCTDLLDPLGRLFYAFASLCCFGAGLQIRQPYVCACVFCFVEVANLAPMWVYSGNQCLLYRSVWTSASLVCAKSPCVSEASWLIPCISNAPSPSTFCDLLSSMDHCSRMCTFPVHSLRFVCHLMRMQLLLSAAKAPDMLSVHMCLHSIP